MSSPSTSDSFEQVDAADVGEPPVMVTDDSEVDTTTPLVNDSAADAANAALDSLQADLLGGSHDVPTTATPVTPSGGAPAVSAGAASGTSAGVATTVGNNNKAAAAAAPCCDAAAMLACVQKAYAAVHPVVSWREPVTSGAVLLGVVAMFTLFVVMEVSVPAFLLYSAVLALGAAGVAVAVKPYCQVPHFPPSAVSASAYDAHGDVVVEGVRQVVNHAVAQYTTFRRLLTWEDVHASVFALAVLYLLARNSCLFSPGVGFFATLMLFTLPYMYNLKRAQVDAFVRQTAMPIAGQVGTHATAARDAFTPVIAGAAFGLGLAVMLFTGMMSVSSWLLLSAWTFVLLDVLPSLRPKAA